MNANILNAKVSGIKLFTKNNVAIEVSETL